MSDLQLAERIQSAYREITTQLSQVIVGQQSVIDSLLLSLFCGGNSLLTGVPGLAKTLLIRSLAQTISLSFSRIQFTPDLMPSDITGTEILQQDRLTGQRELRFQPGPLFAHLVLADEINRTPPKTQAALLEAMQESQVTCGGETFPLPSPFFVFATENPIEQGGTYPLPEAQLDRFMFNIPLEYPTESEELAVILNCRPGASPSLKPVIDGPQLIELQELVRRVPVDEATARMALDIVRLTRPSDESASVDSSSTEPLSAGSFSGNSFSVGSQSSRSRVQAMVRKYVRWGAGPRAGQFILLAARGNALLQGRLNPLPEDVIQTAPLVLRHRVLMNFQAEAENVTPEMVISAILDLFRPGV